MLPDIWQTVSKANPILYMVDGFRYSFHGISDIAPFISLIMIAVFCAIFYGINIYMFRKGKGIRS